MKKIICLAICACILLSCTCFASAAESQTPIIIKTLINTNGEEVTYSYFQIDDGICIEAHLNDGTLIERSVLTKNTVIQEIANGRFDGSVYQISDCVTAVDENECNVSSCNPAELQSVSSNPWYNPPQTSDAGLSNSTVFSGYKFLGTTSPDSVYGVSVSVHRKLQDMGTGEAYKFTVSAGTTVATLIGILSGIAISATPAGLPASIATALASAFIGAGIDTATTGTLKFAKYHYTFKFNCNNSKSYSYKCCECKEWWFIYDAKGNMKGYESKDMMADNHLTINIIAKCEFALQDYINGVQTNATCANAAP